MRMHARSCAGSAGGWQGLCTADHVLVPSSLVLGTRVQIYRGGLP